MKLQWDHMYLLQCGLLCVGSTLELSQCTDTVVAYLSGGQMNTVMLDYLCIQFFHNEIDIPFLFVPPLCNIFKNKKLPPF